MKTQFTMPYLLVMLLLTVSSVFATNSTVAPPSNDLITNAIDIDQGPFPYSELAVNFSEATNNNDTPGGACGVATTAIWYKFTANSSASVSALIVSPQSPIVIFFSAPNENVTLATQLTYVNQGSNPCSNGSSSTIETTAGTTYYILMKNSSTSDVLININAALIPENDLIENAINLNTANETPYSEADVNFPAATNTNDHTTGSGCTVSHEGVWYKFTATKVGNVAAGILNPNGATVIFFHGPVNATDGTQLTYVDQNNNPCSLSPLANIDTTIGVTYYIYMRNLQVSDITINASAAFQKPANDLIINATDIALASQPLFDESIHFLVTTSTNDGGQMDCTTGNFDGVWYKITAEVSGTIEAVMEGSLINESVMVFYSAPNANVAMGSELTWVDQPNNPCGLFNSSSIEAEAGTTYYLFAFSAQPYANVTINAGSVLGISENILEGFKFYPNPVKSELNLSAKTTIDQVNIYNLLGQQVFAEKMNTSNKAINLSNLSKGLYVMTVTSEGNTASYKILKE